MSIVEFLYMHISTHQRKYFCDLLKIKRENFLKPIFSPKYWVKGTGTNLEVCRLPWSGRTRHDLLRWQLLHGTRTACLPSVLRPSPCYQSPSHQVLLYTATNILIIHLDFSIHSSIKISTGSQVMLFCGIFCESFCFIPFTLLSIVDVSW